MRMRWIVQTLLLAAVLPFGWSCAPSFERENVLGTGTISNPVRCPRLAVAADTQAIGSNGGTLESGKSRLKIPRQPDKEGETVYTFAVERTDTIIVTVTPSESLQNPARLTINLSHCPGDVVRDGLRIVRLEQKGGPGETLETKRRKKLWLFKTKDFYTWIERSSHYMIVN